MPSRFDKAIADASAELAKAGNPDVASGMARYMKTEMPFFGVQKPGRAPILKRLLSTAIPENDEEYQVLVSDLWDLPHREEKYLALSVADRWKAFHRQSSLVLFERMIREGAWWDLVDHAATRLVGPTLINSPEAWPTIDGWIESDDLWIRRSAIICQIKAKTFTDRERLANYCVVSLNETDFFIRKAIGWALREYAKTDTDWVKGFVSENRQSMASLSYREATKHF